jgi:hypothetical protein
VRRGTLVEKHCSTLFSAQNKTPFFFFRLVRCREKGQIVVFNEPFVENSYIMGQFHQDSTGSF